MLTVIGNALNVSVDTASGGGSSGHVIAAGTRGLNRLYLSDGFQWQFLSCTISVNIHAVTPIFIFLKILMYFP
jgi:hypothetical protein